MTEPATPITTWTYWLPSMKSEGYAWIVMDSAGRFTTISDYGNYGYWWSNWGDGDFRDFVRLHLCQDAHYLVRKLGADRGQVFKVSDTQKAIYERIDASAFDDEQKEYERDLVRNIDNEFTYTLWYNQTRLDDLTDIARYDYHPQLYAFIEKVIPRLKAVLDAERAEKPSAPR